MTLIRLCEQGGAALEWSGEKRATQRNKDDLKWSNIKLCLTQLFLGAIVKFVELEVFSASNKEVLLWVERG